MMLIASLLFSSLLAASNGFTIPHESSRTKRSTRLEATTAHHVVYTRTINSIANILDESKDSLVKLEALAQKLQNLELRDPHVAEMLSNDALKQAVAEAKAACDAYGPASPQAELAWSDVDKVAGEQGSVSSHPSYRYSAAALQSHHTYNTIVDTGLLEQSIHAAESLLALEHFVQVEKNRLDRDKQLSTS